MKRFYTLSILTGLFACIATTASAGNLELCANRIFGNSDLQKTPFLVSGNTIVTLSSSGNVKVIKPSGNIGIKSTDRNCINAPNSTNYSELSDVLMKVYQSNPAYSTASKVNAETPRGERIQALQNALDACTGLSTSLDSTINLIRTKTAPVASTLKSDSRAP